MGLAPDQTDDMRGGMGLTGVMNLQKFVQDGGLFMVISTNSAIPITYGMTSGVAIQTPRQLQARGSIFNSRFTDRHSPIAYGYDETVPIYFNQAPLLQVQSQTAGAGGGEGGPGGGGGPAGRPSGRGGVSDPDVVQGMPLAEPTPPRQGGRGEDQITDEQRRALGPYLVPVEQRPRVILRFASDEKNLLISGMLAGGSELANAPAIVDVPVGRGHVVMFANNPMWRHQTQGSFFMVFNAALNFDSLNTSRAPAPGPARTQTGETEQDQEQ